MDQTEIPGTEPEPTPATEPTPADAETGPKKPGRKKGQKNKPRTESARGEAVRQERKDPDDIKDLYSGIHGCTIRQQQMIDRLRIEHPDADCGDAVDPFNRPAREPIPPEMIRPMLDIIVGIVSMLCKPKPETVPTPEAIDHAARAWSEASIYLPLPSPAAIAITGACFATGALVAPMAIARLTGDHALDPAFSLIVGGKADEPRGEAAPEPQSAFQHE